MNYFFAIIVLFYIHYTTNLLRILLFEESFYKMQVSSCKFLERKRKGWIPTFVGMTEKRVGMTEKRVGMTYGGMRMTEKKKRIQ